MGCDAIQNQADDIWQSWQRTTLCLWLPAFSMMMVSTLSYIDRNTLALLAPAILRDLRITNEQYGYIISGFSIAYMLFNPLWGRIVDRFGVRGTMGAAVSMWTLTSSSPGTVRSRAGSTKATVAAWRVALEARGLGVARKCRRSALQTAVAPWGFWHTSRQIDFCDPVE